MKKFLLSLVSLFALTLLAVAGEPTKVLTFPAVGGENVNGYTTEWTATVGEDAWVIYGFNTNKNAATWTYVRCGQKAVEQTATITSPAVDVAITDVVITVDKTSKVTNASLTVLNGTETVQDIDITSDFEAGDVDVKVEGAAGYCYKLTVTSEVAGSNGTTQISKVALYEDGQYAEVHIANTAETAYTVAQAIELIDAGQALTDQVYVKGIVNKIEDYNEANKNITYWISDDGQTAAFEVFRGKGFEGADVESADEIQVGATVIVTGTLTKYGEIYEFAQGNQLVSYEAPATVTFPVTIATEEAEMDNWTITSDDTFHRNTWSTENDESGMKTPFIEAWRGTGNMLNDATISHTTIEGLTPGSYTVKIFARAFNEGNATDYPSGITFFANGTEVVMTEVGSTSLFNDKSTVLYGTLVADCTVGEDGKLDLGFTITNAVTDWLAFKNLEIIYNDPVIPTVTAATGKMGAAVAEAQTTAIAAFEATPTPETYEAAKAAIAAAQKSADFYAPFVAAVDALDEAGKAKFAEDEIAAAYEAGTLDETTTEGITAAIVTAQKAQTTAGADLSLVATSTAWTCPQGNGPGWYGAARETYSTSAYTAGKVMYQRIEGLVPGTYEVTFIATANMAWIGVATGENIAQIYANNDTYDIEVIGQTACTPADYERVYNVVVGEDGVLEYGLQNIAEGGNWYVAQALGLKLIEVAPEPEIELTYVDLTDDMFHEWDGVDANAQITGSVPNIYFESHIGEEVAAGGVVYGTSTVAYKSYAALAEYKTLKITRTNATGGLPRLLFGRLTDGGNEYIEISNAESEYIKATEDDGLTWIIDLDKIKENKEGLANLNVIKASWGGAVTIASIQLGKIGEDVPEIADVTDLIQNPAYLENGYEGWTYTENAFKARNYEAPMNLITYSGNAAFEVSQTIENVPAGLYKLTVNAFYRAGNLEDEQAKVAAGTELEKELTFYADVKDAGKYSKKVMNLSEGAADAQVEGTGVEFSEGKYVPNSASDSRTWYIAGQYLNEVLFNVFEDGTVTIGVSKTEGLPGDYCPIGAWKLYRLGDADESAATPDEEPEPEPEPEIATVKMTYVDMDKADEAMGEVTEAMTGYNNIVNGEITMANTGWGCNWITYIQVDASALAGDVKNAQLTIAATVPDRAHNIGVGYNSSVWSADMTYNTADKSIITLGETQTIAASKGSTASGELTFDITGAFADGAKTATILVYDLAAGGTTITSATAVVETGDPEIEIDGIIYAIKSGNLIPNGSFDDNFAGWTQANDFATEISENGFEIQSEDGHENFLVGTKNEGAGGANSLGTAWSIEAGKTYLYSFDVKSINAESGPATYLKSSLTNNIGDETFVLDVPNVTPGEWTSYQKVFTNEEYQYLQVKFRWLAGNFGLDNFALYEVELKTSAVEAAKKTAIAAIDALAPVGDGIFQYAPDAIATAKAAVEAAETVEAVEAVPMPKLTAPAADQLYILSLKTSDEASPFQLSITTEGIKIEEEGSPTFIVAQEDGTFALSNGTEYVNYAGGDRWTMTASEEAYGWMIAAVEGGYTITGKNGLLGTNTSDGNAAGSPCYGDKNTSNGNCIWTIEKGPDFIWSKNIIKNGDMEGDDISCFFKTEQGVGGPYNATITPGAGKDGTAGIEVQSGNNPKEDWDTQFFIRMPYILSDGTDFLVEFDYKADKNAATDTQAHHEPGTYNHWACVGSPDFTTEWQHYKMEATVAGDMNKNGGFMTITFNLAKEKTATKYSFDNIKVYVHSDVLDTLEPAPERSIITGIDGIDAASMKANGKYLDNNKIVILRNGKKYNVQGMELK